MLDLYNLQTIVLRLKKAQDELDVVTSQLREKQDKLSTIEAKVCSDLAQVFGLLFF